MGSSAVVCDECSWALEVIGDNSDYRATDALLQHRAHAHSQEGPPTPVTDMKRCIHQDGAVVVHHTTPACPLCVVQERLNNLQGMVDAMKEGPAFLGNPTTAFEIGYTCGQLHEINKDIRKQLEGDLAGRHLIHVSEAAKWSDTMCQDAVDESKGTILGDMERNHRNLMVQLDDAEQRVRQLTERLEKDDG